MSWTDIGVIGVKQSCVMPLREKNNKNNNNKAVYQTQVWYNLPAMKIESNKTHMSPLSGPSWRKDMKSGVMEVFLRHPACCKVYKSGYPSI